MEERMKINEAKVAILSTNGFEQSELEAPRSALQEAGATVTVIAPEGSEIKGWQGGGWGDPVDVDLLLDDAKASDFDALVLPGGVINPDQLRVNEAALTFVRQFVESGRVVAAICHAPWTMINAGVVRNRKMTSYPSVRKDLENAGAQWVDEAVVVDKGIITSRNPGDLDAFITKIIEEIQEGRHQRAA